MKKLRETLSYILPNLFFVLLVISIFLPAKVEIENRYVFLIVVIALEINLLVKIKKQSSRDIGTVLFLFLLVWEFVTTKFETNNTMLYPVPERVFNVFVTDAHKVIEGIFSSLYLLFLGFLIALILGVGLGLLVGWFDRLKKAVYPIAQVISPIPPIIYMPYAVALLPSFDVARVFVVACAIFWPTFINTVLSVGSIDKKLLDSARTLNVSSWTLLVNILLPYSVPGIIHGVTLSVGASFMVLTGAEMLGSTSGLGWFVKYYSDFSDYTRVVSGIIMIGIVVTVINKGIGWVSKKLVKWK
ncbi:MAG: ABC transporter permease subunit [Lachnospiraceae bacterium]|nr:ABC transporter permease subunit [Lachnospiraceae bacterium]